MVAFIIMAVCCMTILFQTSHVFFHPSNGCWHTGHTWTVCEDIKCTSILSTAVVQSQHSLVKRNLNHFPIITGISTAVPLTPACSTCIIISCSTLSFFTSLNSLSCFVYCLSTFLCSPTRLSP